MRRIALACLVVAGHARAQTSEPVRVAAQVGGGSLGGLGGGFLGGVAGFAIGGALSHGRQDEWKPLGYGVIGAMVVGAAGVVAGVQLAGDATDGTGRWYGTAIGGALGTGAFVGAWWLSEKLEIRMPRAVGFTGMAALVLGGPILGYRLGERAPVVAPIAFGSF